MRIRFHGSEFAAAPPATPRRLRGRTRRSGRQRGSSLIEAAMIMPVLMLITFGIIEFGMLYGNVSTVSSSSRSAARLGATGYTAAADKTAYVVTMGAAARKDLSALSQGYPIQMWVYKANTGLPAACTAANNCWLMTWSSSTKNWNAPTGGWTNPDACGTVLDTIGVYVEAQHKFVTGFFGSTKTVSAKTVMRIEPLPTDQCAAGS